MRLSIFKTLILAAVFAASHPIQDPNLKRPPFVAGPVPASLVNCTGYTLDGESIQRTLDDFIEWGKRFKLQPKGFRMVIANDVVSYVCNCKWWHKDPIPEAEILHVQRIIEDECGRNRSGWVWSQQWDKMYEIEPLEWTEKLEADPWQEYTAFCPPCCAYDKTAN
ncbi:hypothetical protein AAE478_000622 [Parahypoxylon ruwenzoriense]